MELAIYYGDMSPKQVAERKGEEPGSHADTVAFVFSSKQSEIEPVGAGKDAIPLEGSALFIMNGDHVRRV